MTTPVPVADPGLPTGAMVEIAVALTILAASAFNARRSFRLVLPGSGPAGRVLGTSALLALSTAALQLAVFPFGAAPGLAHLASVPLLVGAIVLLPVGATEWALRPSAPRRTLPWLGASAAIFVTALYLVLALGVQLGQAEPPSLVDWLVGIGWGHVLSLSLFGSAALLWWSLLPPSHPSAAVFE